jgi:hypothetical protein
MISRKSKGGSAKAAAKESQAFTRELRNLFRQQFSHQQEILGFLEKHLMPMLEDPQGFFPGEEAALRTSASERTSLEFDSALRSAQERSFMLGGRELPSGALGAEVAALEGLRAVSESEGQRGIDLAEAQLRRSNFFNAAQLLSGGAAMLDPSNLGQLAVMQGDSAFKQLKATSGSMWGKILGAVAGGVASTFLPGVGSLLAGKLGTMLGGAATSSAASGGCATLGVC